MKIGVLTHYFNSLNYGGMLQAYALAAFLRKHGLDAEQISYRFSSKPFESKPKSVSPAPQAQGLHRLAARCRNSLRYRLVEKPRRTYYENYRKTEILRRADAFSSFQQLIPHSDRVFETDTVAEAANQYDCLITGSDQVWNFDWFNPPFFLDFPDCHAKRIAYAASAGRARFSEAETSYLTRVLPAIQAVSVREKNLAETLNSILGADSVKTAVDPTLLLSAEEWKAVAAPRLIEKKYLFCYYLHNDRELSRTARAFARKNHLTIAAIPFPGIEYNEEDIRFGSCRFDAAGPREFLSLILYADFVLTDSFHASVFSLIFGKQFFAFPRGDAVSMGSRLQTLTELFGCPERFCDVPEKDRLSYISGMKTLSVQDSGADVQQQKDASEAFLLNALGKG